MKSAFPCIFVSALFVMCMCARSGAEPEMSVANILSNAVQEIRVFNFSDAYTAATRAQSMTEKGSEEWQESVFCRAVCAQQRTPLQKESLDEAVSLFTLLITTTPNSRFTPRSTMNLGRIYELQDFHDDPVDLDKARAYYLNVIDRWPHDRIASEAALRVACTYIQTYSPTNVQKGIAFLEQWLEEHSENPYVSAMWQYLGNTYLYPVRDYARAFKCYKIADTYGILTRSERGTIYWNMARIAETVVSNRADAVTYYTKIITEEPSSGKAYEAQQALRRLGAPVPEISIFTRTVTPSSHPVTQ